MLQPLGRWALCGAGVAADLGEDVEEVGEVVFGEDAFGAVGADVGEG